MLNATLYPISEAPRDGTEILVPDGEYTIAMHCVNDVWMDAYETHTYEEPEVWAHLPGTVPVWKPIETAPKDGTKILFRYKDSDNPEVAHWDQRDDWWTDNPGMNILYGDEWTEIPS